MFCGETVVRDLFAEGLAMLRRVLEPCHELDVELARS